MSAIEVYVSDLDRRLSGSAGAKTDLLTEARDGLADAAAAYREGGANWPEAERCAVADFGPADVIVRAYQQELAMRGDIGTLWKVNVGVPLFQLSWELARIWSYGDWSKMGKPTPGWYLVLVDLSAVFVVVSPVLGAAALLGTRWLGRRLDGERSAKVARWFVIAAAIMNLVAILLLAVGTAVLDPARMNLSLPCNVLAVGWVAFSLWLLPLAFRSWRPRTLTAA